jgi:hypothetical protein
LCYSFAKGFEQRALGFMHSTQDKRTRVRLSAFRRRRHVDSFVLQRNLSQDQFELYAAAQPGSPAPAFDELRTIAGIALRPMNFGPSLWE